MDDRGIIAAGPIANVLNIPLVYWNLELRFLDEATDSAAVRRKRQEIRWCKQAVLTISQDRWRAKALAEENGLDETQIALVPIASLGAAQRRRSNYLRARLGIAQGRKIVLCTGGFAWWTHTLEIVRAAPTWPMDYVLVVHSLTRKTDVTDYMKLVTDSADGVHSIVSFDPVSSEDYQNVVDSADIGLAWYHIWDPVSHRLNKNMLFMGHSSGKLADYLKSGLPVVVNKSLGPSELIEEYRCGISVQEPGQLGTALRRILDEYDSCAANAVRCFNERLELRRNFTKVLDRIEAAIQPALQRVRSDASPAMRVHL
jgi:glycosyltransferase involved in cell wall biosynthesis